MTTEPPGNENWDPWTPFEIARRFRGIDRPWCVAGGWALDLWHGRQTRQHEDLECTILSEDLALFQSVLPELQFYGAKSGQLIEMPADRPADDVHQFWGLDRVNRKWRVDLMIEPGSDETWVYKRDHSVCFPREDIVMRTTDGIPYLNPVAVLLFKAKHRRQKDEGDLHLALPKLSQEHREMLSLLLRKLHPESGWIAHLEKRT